jgi:hypothetical protein
MTTKEPQRTEFKLDDFRDQISTFLYQEDHDSNDKPRGWHQECYLKYADRLIEFISSLEFSSKPKAFYQQTIINQQKEHAALIAELERKLKDERVLAARLFQYFKAGSFTVPMDLVNFHDLCLEALNAVRGRG